MHAVLNVIMNRAGGDVRNASRVCLAPRAFGYWNNKEIVENIEGARTHPCWMQALALIDRALRGQLPDITGGANHFYNPHLARPSWSNEMQRTARIGHHVFLKDE